ncbi:MAG: hypothetical protein OXU77_01525 [Gammaproteobacteria bacterium]|nr:hypothetical protein [Gammaproteobacteria bacterium]MDE0443894.1 hypothetical protein [Gammaproteobacteria bacterium]
MTPEMVAIIGVGIAMLGVWLGGIRPHLRDLSRDVADLRERMARVEGLFEGFTGRHHQEV